MHKLSKFYFCCFLGIVISCNRLSDGEKTYINACANCHMENGQGVANLVPAIVSAKFVNGRNQLICLMIEGSKDSTSQFGMPSYQKLSNAQIANVLNYINSKKKFNGAFFNENEIEGVRQSCPN